LLASLERAGIVGNPHALYRFDACDPGSAMR
jgi:hypothetical protein